MREIKFRAWDCQNNKWIKSTKLLKQTFLDLEFSLVHDYFLDEFTIERNAWIIEQYTGLKDKNGKEIYEGDILRSKSWGNSRTLNPYHVVEWVGVGWCAVGYNGVHKVRPSLDVKKDFEIIGNIHENPELINL